MDVITNIENQTLIIQFNRPHKKNSITAAMYQTMADALTDSQNNPQVRVILFVGHLEVFSAGNDLADFLQQPALASDTPVIQFLNAISTVTKPMVAAVAGLAVGIGTTLLLHCDLVYAAPNAKFSMPFAQLGLCPEAASSLLLPNLCGYQRAAEKLMLGEAFDVQEAYQMGLVNHIVEQGSVEDYAKLQIKKLLALPSSALLSIKKLMKAGLTQQIAQQIKLENEHFGQLLASPAAKEAMQAFMEKRKPDFSKLN